MVTSFKEAKVREGFSSPNEVAYIRHFETAVLGHRINIKGGVVPRLNKQSPGRCLRGVCLYKVARAFAQDCSDRGLLWSHCT